MKALQINTDATIRREAISTDHHCVIVDEFLRNPDELVEFAALHAGEFSNYDSGYPGRQFHVNDDLMGDVYRFIRFEMTQHFPFFKGSMILWTLLSMVTLRPNELSARQRICHTDPIPSPGRTVYAGLLYLFKNEDLGGTGFYRWKDKELLEKVAAVEREDPERGWAYRQEKFPTFREPARYMTDSNEIAELCRTISPHFNRLIFYWGGVPHSGTISAPELLSADVKRGRLTLNVFASVLPKTGTRPAN